VYGNARNLSQPTCSGLCPAGYYCPGTAPHMPTCVMCVMCVGVCFRGRGGHVGGALGCARLLCCVCAGATVTPLPCGNVTVYCPTGSSAPILVPPGFYSAGGANASVMSQVRTSPSL
jgi:hypothetical protein